MIMADQKGDIIYANSAMVEMFRAAAADIRTHIPGFNPDRLVGCNMSAFHSEPERQRRFLRELTERHQME
ncbi:MAG: hypothetical protein GY896_13065, partial [Gammaproteobacteria bacterium]|nr:hypothetical protein [Gammaproteobacteria bacterium]